jgi:hypothetical protein
MSKYDAERQRAYREANREEVLRRGRERDAERRLTSGRKEYQASYHREWRVRNAERIKENDRAYYEANKDELNAKQRIIALRNFYNLTEQDYLDLLASQGGVCAICGGDDPGTKKGGWAVDHDHSCCPGKKSCGACVRGLLCRPCNSGLGHLRDSPLLLHNAIAYLDRFR